MLKLNDIYCGRAEELSKSIDSDSVDLVVTSPPYAGKRGDNYETLAEDFYPTWLYNISQELMRVIKPTGSMVINIKEGVTSGRRQTYVMKYVLMMAEAGYWAETYIWNKTNPFPTGSKKRLKDGFEYCFQFVKGDNWKYFPQNCLVPANMKWINGNRKRKNKGEYSPRNGSELSMATRYCDSMARPSNVITCPNSCLNLDHPATFPIALPEFFIKLMTEEGDLVLDPFMGSGTTALACMKLKRKYIGIDASDKYVLMALDRIEKESSHV